MTEQTTEQTVRRTVTVAVPVQRAFTVFTERFTTWWPETHHIAPVDMAEAVIEPREGGRWYERGVDGSECDWGRVLAWEPPTRLVLSWHLDGEWKFDPDLAKASEVEVRFISEGPATTRVELEHRHFERHGATADSLRTSVSADGGWGTILEGYAKVAGG